MNRSTLAAAALFTSIGAIQAQAAIINGGFNGNFNGWVQEAEKKILPAHGDPSVANAMLDTKSVFSAPGQPGLTPTEGSHFAYLEASTKLPGTSQEYVTTPFAAINQIFTVTAGQRLVGDFFAFLEKDGAESGSEFAIVLLDGEAPGLGASVAEIVHPHIFPASIIPGPDSAEMFVPWNTFEYTFETEGVFWLQVYVQATSVGTTGTSRAIGGVDNIRILPPAAPIPEPSTIAIWSLLGFIGIGGAAWRRRRKQAA